MEHINNLGEAVEVLRNKLGGAVPLSLVAVFLAVANCAEKGTTHDQLSKITGISQPVVSRLVKSLTVYYDKRGQLTGDGLLENYPDPWETRRFRTRLTEEGIKLASQLSGLFK